MTMTICEHGHEAVCYEDHWHGHPTPCPACKAIKERDKLQARVEELEMKIKYHEDE